MIEVRINKEVRDDQESLFFSLRSVVGSGEIGWICVLAAFPFVNIMSDTPPRWQGPDGGEALGRTTDYVKNPEKTNGGNLVTACQCNPAIVNREFLTLKLERPVV